MATVEHPAPEAAPGRKLVRLTLEMSPELNEALERAAAEIGGTVGDVLLRAIAFYLASLKFRREGKFIGMAAEEQALETVFDLFGAARDDE